MGGMIGRRTHTTAAIFLAAATGIAGCGTNRPPATPKPAATADRPALTPMQRLVPAPVTVEPAAGVFTFTADTVIAPQAGNADVRRIADYLAALVGTSAAPTPPRVEAGSSATTGVVSLALASLPDAGDEGYELTISPQRVALTANRPAGLFYGVQTLRQMLPTVVEHKDAAPVKGRTITLPAGRIDDRPRFAWRGAMLDVARHFFGPDDVKRYIDLIAMHKVNRLHLHLSDDQGWRIEIKSWPNLTTHGGSTAVGGGAGGFYTQETYAAIVKYASDRFVTIVPEIDMPGHTNAALASYPELNCDGKAPDLYTGIRVGFSTLCVDKDVTYKFIDDVVREIAAMTPGPYFHAGGDEVEKLTPAQYRQFIERVQGIVRAHGKRMIGWDEIGPATLDPSSIVQLYRPKAVPREAVAQGAKVILSPADRAYLDMKYRAATPIGLSWAGMVELRDAYDWEPATRLDGVPESAILGI
jgi:hexosaminidase